MSDQTYVNAAGIVLALTTTPSSNLTTYWAAYDPGVVTTPADPGHTLYGDSGDDEFVIFAPTDEVVIPTTPHGIYTIADSAWDSSYTLPAGINNLIVSGTGDTDSGNSQDNLIETQSGEATVSGGGGDDVFVLGTGADTIIDPQGSGSDVIYNFNASIDVVRLDGSTQFTSWASVQSALTQDGSDVVLNMGDGQTLTFRNETVADLSASDFTLPVDTADLPRTFDDEFNTFVSSPDGSSGWMTSWPYGGISNRSFPSMDSYFSDSSVGVNPFTDVNGILDLTTSVAAPGSNPDNLPYNTGTITTYKSFSQLYGYFEIRCELPAGQGLWPSFYMESYDNSAELDVFEILGLSPTIDYTTVHDWTTDTATTAATTIPNSSTGFHTYGVDWEPNTITFYVDGQIEWVVPTPASMHVPMYMIAEMAVGMPGSWAEAPSTNSIFPATMQIDYIRAYATAATQDVGGLDAIPLPISVTPATNSVTTKGTASVNPFSGVVITDDNASQTETATVTLSSTANGTLSDPNAATDGSKIADGILTVSGSATAVASALDGLVFTPQSDQSAASESTTLTAAIQDTDGETASTTATVISTPAPTADILSLQISEDYWEGDAEFTVDVNGNQVGGVYTASALHSSGDAGTFLLSGDWNSGVNDVQVNFINDAYGGTPETDRNLYVDSLAYNGITYAGTSVTLGGDSSGFFKVGGTTPVADSPPDTLTLNLSEDAWDGDAQFALYIDGQAVTSPQVVTALHEAGQTEAFSFTGAFGAGTHTIGIDFLNDAYGGRNEDRNLYVNGVTLNGTDIYSGSKEEYADGIVWFTATTTQ